MNIYIILKLHLPSLFFFLTCLGISITANLKPENTPNWRWRNLFRHLCFFSLAKRQNMMTVIVKRLYFPLETIFLQIWSKLVSFMMKLFSATFCLLVQLFWNTVCIVMAHNSIISSNWSIVWLWYWSLVTGCCPMLVSWWPGAILSPLTSSNQDPTQTSASVLQIICRAEPTVSVNLLNLKLNIDIEN